MNTNTTELNLNEMENVNGGFSMEELLVKVGFFFFKPSKPHCADKNLPVYVNHLVKHS